MVTYKSLFVSCALIVALIGAGVLAVSAHTLAPAQQQHTALPYQNGIAAIAVGTGKHRHVSLQDVRTYIKSKGFIGGSTLTGAAPALKNLQLTNIIHLDSLLYSLLAQLPGNKSVYFAQLEGPFIVLPQLPLPVLTTLVPSATNLPAFLPHLSNLSSLGLTNPLFGLLPIANVKFPHALPVFHGPRRVSVSSGILRMPDLSHLQSSGSQAKPHPATSPSSAPGTPQPGTAHKSGNASLSAQPDSAQESGTAALSKSDVDTIIGSAYEVFDATTGNLLAWG